MGAGFEPAPHNEAEPAMGSSIKKGKKKGPVNMSKRETTRSGKSVDMKNGMLMNRWIWKKPGSQRWNITTPKLNRKLVHITIGLAFMLCWPLFSSGSEGAFTAALVPGVNIVKMLLIGLGILKDEATVKSMSRYGDYRELKKGPLYYAFTITFCCMVYWRTSPVAIAAICNLSAGDGFADIIGRRFGKKKLPYNKDKSFAGSIAMAISSFLSSVGYMYYYSLLGFMEIRFGTVVGFLMVSVASALVESHPLSTKFDDNLTVPLVSVLLGIFVF